MFCKSKIQREFINEFPLDSIQQKLHIPNNYENFKIADIFKDIEYIPLYGDTIGFIYHIRKLLVSKDRFIVLADTKNNKSVLSFDKSGNFICYFGEIGEGIGEYPYAEDIFIDEENNKLYIYIQGGLMTYDLDNGNYQSSKKVIFTGMNMVMNMNRLLLACLGNGFANIPQFKKSGLILVNYDTDSIIDAEFNFNRSYNFIPNLLLYNTGSSYLYHDVLDNTIYKITFTDAIKIVKSYWLDIYGDQNSNEIKLMNNTELFDNWRKSNRFFLGDFSYKYPYLYLKITDKGLLRQVVYNEVNNKIRAINQLGSKTDQNDPIVIINSPLASDNQFFYSIVETDVFQNFIDQTKSYQKRYPISLRSNPNSCAILVKYNFSF